MVWRGRTVLERKGLLEAASKVSLTGSKSNVRELGLHWEDNFWMIFGVELDGGKWWRRRLLGARREGLSMVWRGRTVTSAHGVEGSSAVLLCGGENWIRLDSGKGSRA